MRSTAERHRESVRSAGRIELQLGAGSYTIRPASDTHIRVTIGSESGRARVALTANATRATVAVTETPSSNFQATIEVPKTSDLIVRLSGGNLVLSGITGNKDIDSVAGNAEISVGDPNEYGSMEATVKAGDLNVGAFAGAKTSDCFGLLHRASWSAREGTRSAPISAPATSCCASKRPGVVSTRGGVPAWDRRASPVAPVDSSPRLPRQ